MIGVLGVLGCRFDLQPAQWVKDPVLLQLQLRSHLWLGSDLWLGHSICHKVAPPPKKIATPLSVAPVPLHIML